jgi:uncharacterized membrane protein YgcG
VILSRRLAAAVLGAAGALSAASLAAAPAALPPAPQRWVTDTASFLSEAAHRSLDERLEAYERQTGHQVLVWIGRTTGDIPLEDFTVRAFKEWKPGRKGLDDGLVLFVLADDRKIRFEVGYGLEDRIPDLVASRIIREVMAPRIQAGDRDGAVKAGVEAALAAIEGRPVPGEGDKAGLSGAPSVAPEGALHRTEDHHRPCHPRLPDPAHHQPVTRHVAVAQRPLRRAGRGWGRGGRRLFGGRREVGRRRGLGLLVRERS